METKSHQSQSFDSLENIQNALALANAFCNNLSDEMLLDVMQRVARPISEGISSIQPIGLSKRQHEAIYTKAYQLYQSANYEDASKLFTILLREEKTEPRFYKGMASCFQMLKDYENAVSYYGFGYLFDQTDPMPLFYIGQCFSADNKPEDAIGAFEEFVDEAKGNPSLYSMKKQAIALIAALVDVTHLETAP